MTTTNPPRLREILEKHIARHILDDSDGAIEAARMDKEASK